MRAPVVVVGMGQLGAVFAEGFLRLGHPVVPVLRGESIELTFDEAPELIVVAVGEDDLAAALRQVPEALRDRVLLLQNELRPHQWLEAGIFDPTVCVVWFEKKSGTPLRQVRRTVVAGQKAELVARALREMGVDPIVKPEAVGDAEVAHELVLKNLYILGLNLTGLVVGGTAGQMLGEHHGEFERVLDDIFALEAELLDHDASPLSREHLDRPRLERELREAIAGSPSQGASGRSAPRRLERSLEHGAAVGLTLAHLEDLGRRILGTDAGAKKGPAP